MKLKNILFFIIIIISLHIYDPTKTYSIIIDKDEDNNNYTHQEIPFNVNAIHTIDILPKMLPPQLFIKKNQLVKWKNKSLLNQTIICDDTNGNNIFISKNLKPNEFDTFIFTKKGSYEYYTSTNRFDSNSIIVN